METVEIKYPQDQDLVTAFHKVASQVYQDDPIWVPQSDQFIQKTLQASQYDEIHYVRPLVVVKNGSPLARAAAVMPPDAKDEQGYPQGYIAFFECLPGFQQAGQLVLQACEDLLRENDVRSVQAPRLDNLQMGLVINGFDQPHTVFTPHNPPYYQEIFLAQGYQHVETLYSYVFSRQSISLFPLKLPGIRTRTFNRASLEKEVQVFSYLNNEIFRTHPGYVVRSLAEERQMVEAFLPILDDELVIVAETISGSPIGLLICLPDIYQAYQGKSVDSARLITIGAIPSMASKGIGVLMGLHLMRNLLARGYRTLEASWISSTNFPPRNLAKRFNGKLSREFGLFEKSL